MENPFQPVQDTILKPAMVRAILDGYKRETRRVLAPSNTRIEWSGNRLSASQRVIRDTIGRAKSAPVYDAMTGLWGWHQDPLMAGFQAASCHAALKWRAGGTIRVKENFREWASGDSWVMEYLASPDEFYVRAPGGVGMVRAPDVVRPSKMPRIRPSIFLPHDYCRLLLPITDVKIERLCNITLAGIKNEGCTPRIVELGLGRRDQMWAMDWSAVGTRRRFPSPRGLDLVHESDVGHASPHMAFADYINQLNGPGTWTANPVVAVVKFQPL